MNENIITIPEEHEHDNSNQHMHFEYFIIYVPVMFIIYLVIFLCKVPFENYAFNTSSPTAITSYTYSLFHANTLHLIFNLISLLFYGGLCEFDQWPIRTIFIHIYAIILGAAGSVLEANARHEDFLLIGASGGNYGFLGALTGNIIMNWKDAGRPKQIMHLSIIISALISDVVLMFVLSKYTTIQISYGDHVGGLIGGFLASIMVSRNETIRLWKIIVRISTSVIIPILPTLVFCLA